MMETNRTWQTGWAKILSRIVWIGPRNLDLSQEDTRD